MKTHIKLNATKKIVEVFLRSRLISCEVQDFVVVNRDLVRTETAAISAVYPEKKLVQETYRQNQQITHQIPVPFQERETDACPNVLFV